MKTDLQDVGQIERMLHLSGQLSDARRYEELAALFTECGVFIRPSDPDTPIQGHATILQSLLARPSQLGRRHVVLDPFIQLCDAHTAIAHSISILIKSNGNGSGVLSVGGFHDTLVHVGEEWKFAKRAGYTLFNPVSYPPPSTLP